MPTLVVFVVGALVDNLCGMFPVAMFVAAARADGA